jgi:hypothetical protein
MMSLCSLCRFFGVGALVLVKDLRVARGGRLFLKGVCFCLSPRSGGGVCTASLRLLRRVDVWLPRYWTEVPGNFFNGSTRQRGLDNWQS